MKQHRTPAESKVAELLRTARTSLGMGIAFLSRFEGSTQHLEVVESDLPQLFKDKSTQDRATSFCQNIIDGNLPDVIPDVRQFPVAMKLPAARVPRLRSYLSVPITLSDGSLYGTFCVAGFSPNKNLQKRDKALVAVLAEAATLIIEPEFMASKKRAELMSMISPILQSGGPEIVLQPVVRLDSSEVVEYEALSRFPDSPDLTPDLVFEKAHEIGLGIELERAAVINAVKNLSAIEGRLAINISPMALADPETIAALSEFPLARLTLELSEHDPVDDYPALMATLAPLRAKGMRLAIDDVGAGFSTLRHILLTSPDVVKIDRSLVSGVAQDPILQSLVEALVKVATGIPAQIVAEGIETEADALMLRQLGVTHGQGWLYGKPKPAEAH
jgi:EAL domain-containing protein (putative c-di-GMP-specific phosphodiesterase class I)